MIAFRSLALRRGSRLLFSGLDASLHAGWKVAVVGRNGSGKSSLLAAVRGELDSDRGSIDLPAGLRIAAVAQETPDAAEPARDYVLRGDTTVAAAVLAAERADAAGDAAAAAAAHQRMAALDAYDARARVGRLLHGLGFAPETHALPVAEFSGGWRARLNLAQALMRPSDLLLLDEPTNHLDLDAMLWLEQWLQGYRGLLLVISHDREFLDGVADHVLHLAGGAGRLYAGNYSAFERQRAEQLRQQQASAARDAAERAHLQAFVDRFRAKATKARQAQARIKRLEKLGDAIAVRAERPFHFRFPEPERLPQSMLRLEEASAGYAERVVLEGVNLGVDAGARIGLLGANGAGKTTLVRTLVGDLPLIAGTRQAHKDLVIGYFAQHTVEALEAGASPLQHLQALAPEAPVQALRDWLGSWQLGGERVFDPVEHFSGGERARLALALVAWRKPGLLVLDEPTNHLDIEMREALADALNDYPGALLLVAHDRHLLGLVCESFWHVVGGRVQPFAGDLEDYAAWARAERREDAAAAAPQDAAPADGAVHQARRRERRRDENRRRTVERRMDELTAQLQALEQEMADPAIWTRDPAAAAALGARRDALEQARAGLEEEWLELSARIEESEP